MLYATHHRLQTYLLFFSVFIPTSTDAMNSLSTGLFPSSRHRALYTSAPNSLQRSYEEKSELTQMWKEVNGLYANMPSRQNYPTYAKKRNQLVEAYVHTFASNLYINDEILLLLKHYYSNCRGHIFTDPTVKKLLNKIWSNQYELNLQNSYWILQKAIEDKNYTFITDFLLAYWRKEKKMKTEMHDQQMNAYDEIMARNLQILEYIFLDREEVKRNVWLHADNFLYIPFLTWLAEKINEPLWYNNPNDINQKKILFYNQLKKGASPSIKIPSNLLIEDFGFFISLALNNKLSPDMHVKLDELVEKPWLGELSNYKQAIKKYLFLLEKEKLTYKVLSYLFMRGSSLKYYDDVSKEEKSCFATFLSKDKTVENLRFFLPIATQVIINTCEEEENEQIIAFLKRYQPYIPHIIDTLPTYYLLQIVDRFYGWDLVMETIFLSCIGEKACKGKVRAMLLKRIECLAQKGMMRQALNLIAKKEYHIFKKEELLTALRPAFNKKEGTYDYPFSEHQVIYEFYLTKAKTIDDKIRKQKEAFQKEIEKRYVVSQENDPTPEKVIALYEIALTYFKNNQLRTYQFKLKKKLSNPVMSRMFFDYCLSKTDFGTFICLCHPLVDKSFFSELPLCPQQFKGIASSIDKEGPDVLRMIQQSLSEAGWKDFIAMLSLHYPCIQGNWQIIDALIKYYFIDVEKVEVSGFVLTKAYECILQKHQFCQKFDKKEYGLYQKRIKECFLAFLKKQSSNKKRAFQQCLHTLIFPRILQEKVKLQMMLCEKKIISKKDIWLPNNALNILLERRSTFFCSTEEREKLINFAIQAHKNACINFHERKEVVSPYNSGFQCSCLFFLSIGAVPICSLLAYYYFGTV